MSIVARSKVFVGLDYHSGSVQVCVMDSHGKVLLNRSYANERREIVAAVERCCGTSVVVQAAIESCCGAANLAEELVAIRKVRLLQLAKIA